MLYEVITNPLKYDLSNFDFFRVEGLYASSATEAILKINNIIKQFGLDINFNVFDIETDKLELANVITSYSIHYTKLYERKNHPPSCSQFRREQTHYWYIYTYLFG